MIRSAPASALISFSFLLASCADVQNSPKQTLGTLLGAGAGALIGAQVGGGKGKMAAVAIGTLGGAYLGSEVGKTLDYVDRQKAQKAEQSALENNKAGTSTRWVNPDSGNTGKVTPKRATELASGEFCREYEHEITVNGRTEVASGTACRQPNGSWRIIN
ncbi:MAG: RT0821/Lpp0805 family surface protein [Pseudomonadota bacterium]|nr:RT0821/Lpp0805 family surface protein [Pseudomonadota bacterium]